MGTGEPATTAASSTRLEHEKGLGGGNPADVLFGLALRI
jgi:hypothetical protein